MNITITKAAFKKHALKQVSNLRERGITLKLSDVQESLAVAYGYDNLATLYAMFEADEADVINVRELESQASNLFVLTWFDNDQTGYASDEVLGICPPGTTLNSISRMHYSELHTKVKAVPEGFTFSHKGVALCNYAHIPRIEKYGVPDSAAQGSVTQWVKSETNFRVPSSGVDVDVENTGDDSSAKNHLLVWLPNEDAEAVRSWFADPAETEEVEAKEYWHKVMDEHLPVMVRATPLDFEVPGSYILVPAEAPDFVINDFGTVEAALNWAAQYGLPVLTDNEMH